jgi:hypothetical protein
MLFPSSILSKLPLYFKSKQRKKLIFRNCCGANAELKRAKQDRSCHEILQTINKERNEYMHKQSTLVWPIHNMIQDKIDKDAITKWKRIKLT